jgi:putative ABC transport system ATP-binding protein
VAIARAIVNRPPILLADEPTGNLDSKTSQGIMNLLQALNADGMTIVMVTHNSECAQYAGKILRLSDGLLVEDKESRAERGESPFFAGRRKEINGRTQPVSINPGQVWNSRKPT